MPVFENEVLITYRDEQVTLLHHDLWAKIVYGEFNLKFLSSLKKN